MTDILYKYYYTVGGQIIVFNIREYKHAINAVNIVYGKMIILKEDKEKNKI
jgi:hypothetical protein